MNIKFDNPTGKAGAQNKKGFPKWVWLAGLIAIALLFFYLWQVFMAAFMYTQFRVPGHYIPKDGWTLPVYPDDLPKECVPIYMATRMTPYADSQGEMHRFPEFRERGSFWLLDSAKTTMYEVELLKHPRCLQFRLQEIAAAKNRVIFVIYDKATGADVLVIRNYP